MLEQITSRCNQFSLAGNHSGGVRYPCKRSVPPEVIGCLRGVNGPEGNMRPSCLEFRAVLSNVTPSMCFVPDLSQSTFVTGFSSSLCTAVPLCQRMGLVAVLHQVLLKELVVLCLNRLFGHL